MLGDEIIYIGKSDREDVVERLREHESGQDNLPHEAWEDIRNAEVYCTPLVNATMSDVVESELIRRYKPKYNKDYKKNSDWSGLQFNEPEWIHIDNYLATTYQNDPPGRFINGVNPKSIANLRPRSKGKTPKKYMQLDIKGFEEYLNLISKHHGVTRTRYIQNLIRKDMEENHDLYHWLCVVRDIDNKERKEE